MPNLHRWDLDEKTLADLVNAGIEYISVALPSDATDEILRHRLGQLNAKLEPLGYEGSIEKSNHIGQLPRLWVSRRE